jgi:hypothetical protein
MEILNEEAQKVASSKEEFDLLLKKASALLALSMKPQGVDGKAVKNIIEEGMDGLVQPQDKLL